MSHSFDPNNRLPNVYKQAMQVFFDTYVEGAKKNGVKEAEAISHFNTLVSLVEKEIESPSQFEPFHKKINKPFDYFKFGQEFFKALIQKDKSQLFGVSHLNKIKEQIARGENVIFLANHQIEPDPQVISLLLEDIDKPLSEEMIFVAGHRVTTDPLAIPFSLGRNLLCIFSKRHINFDESKKAEKLEHNRQTLKKMELLLAEGGKCIYVAPSGGRDRENSNGVVIPALFDPDSIELFHLISKKAKTKTHFYPMALATYALLPPPNAILKELGELRKAYSAPVFLEIGEEINLDLLDLEGLKMSTLSKQERRAFKANFIYEKMITLYNHLKTL